MSLEDLKDRLSASIFGISRTDAIAQGICLRCKKVPVFASDRDRHEYNLSALCMTCWDEIMITTTQEEKEKTSGIVEKLLRGEGKLIIIRDEDIHDA